jgi:hypothetical protein
MPTPTGLPKAGEVWELSVVIGRPPGPQQVVILERSRGDYWSLRVYANGRGIMLWVDAPYWLKKGWIKYIGEAGPKTRERLGLK